MSHGQLGIIALRVCSQKTMPEWESTVNLSRADCGRLIAASFNNEKSFQNALNNAFEHFINLSSRAPEYISLFMDDKLRKVGFALAWMCCRKHSSGWLWQAAPEVYVCACSFLLQLGLVDASAGRVGVQLQLIAFASVMILVVTRLSIAGPTGHCLTANVSNVGQRCCGLALSSCTCSSWRSLDKLRRARVQGLKGASEDDMEAVLDRVMMLFRYLQEKDVFEKYYKQHLAKRLLSGRTARPQPPQRCVCLLSAQPCQRGVTFLARAWPPCLTSRVTSCRPRY